jgi:hypothetical protein
VKRREGMGRTTYTVPDFPLALDPFAPALFVPLPFFSTFGFSTTSSAVGSSMAATLLLAGFFTGGSSGGGAASFATLALGGGATEALCLSSIGLIFCLEACYRNTWTQLRPQKGNDGTPLKCNVGGPINDPSRVSPTKGALIEGVIEGVTH